ncbi:MAG: carboxypeptidase regulatory-like domain-containing protein [bacterium]|nr:MAG: carboxypeptidase regulatory-like domain-containing protein [bacterium]
MTRSNIFTTILVGFGLIAFAGVLSLLVGGVPQTIVVDGTNDFLPVNLVDEDVSDTEHSQIDIGSVYITHDDERLYIGFEYDKGGWNGNQLGIMIAVGNTSGGTTDAWGHAVAWNTAPTKIDYQAWCNMDNTWQELRKWNGETSSWDAIYDGEQSLGWANNTGFEEIGIGLDTLGVSIGDTVYIEIVSTQEGGSKGPLDCMVNDGDQLSRPSGTTWDVGEPVELDSMFAYVLEQLPIGAIEGTVTYIDPLDDQTVATVSAFDEETDQLIRTVQTEPGGGAYLIGGLPDGPYFVEARAKGYSRIRQPGIVVSQDTVRNIDFVLPRVGKITGEVVFSEGPGGEIAVAAYDSATGEIPDEDARTILPTAGDFQILAPVGTFHVVAAAPGYIADTAMVQVAGNDSIHVGILELSAVRATKLVLIDVDGTEILSTATTISIPDSGIFFYAEMTIEARDDSDRRDLFDLDDRLDPINLRATKLNNYSQPRGDLIFFETDTVQTESIRLTDGRGSFLLRDDEIEVLRVFVENADTTITGRFKIGIRSPEPEYFELYAVENTVVADGTDEVVIRGQLLDINLNPVRIAGVEVNFSFDQSSTGQGTFTIPSTETSANGEFFTSLTATIAGKLLIRATAFYGNKELGMIGDEGGEFVEVTVVPGPVDAIRITSTMSSMGINETMPIEAQKIDVYGNAVPQAGGSITFTYYPVSAGTLTPLSADFDADGKVVAEFSAGSRPGIVEIDGTAGAFPVEGTTFFIEQISTISFSDPSWPEPDPAHNTLEQMDLTDVSVQTSLEGFKVTIDFSSTWSVGNVHIATILETGGDAAGAPSDPFEFPIRYGHSLRPEYTFTYKYTSDEYADFRKWANDEWNWWDDGSKTYISTSDLGNYVETINVRESWVEKGPGYVEYTIPYRVFRGRTPISLRAQVYIMYEVYINDIPYKHGPFDSSPHDSTLDLEEEPADWGFEQPDLVLHYYSPPLILPGAPVISSRRVEPTEVQAGGMVRFTATLTDADDGIGNVYIDLSPLGGPRFQRMKDDGTNGDVTPGDGTYSHQHLVAPDISTGSYELQITARDSLNINGNVTTVIIDVEGAFEPIRRITDETGDDHGPNLFGRTGLYYNYPSNVVFVLGAFDLEEVVIFETTNIFGGEVIPSYAFMVRMGNFPNPADEGTADWNPTYADINIQKIDIYIDALKGGATEGLPNRQNDFAKWDAWDYAIVMDGWYKGVITSNNQNTPAAWSSTARKGDNDIVLLSDYNQNTITAIVSKDALGNPTEQDILKWDITVLMTSHDGHSDDNNFGDTRWVNDASDCEWRFCGGLDSDRDPNIIDMVTSPGLGKKAGRSQSDLLNYKSREAVKRSERGETAVVLEATAFEDQGPPVISISEIIEETVPYIALINAPLYYTAVISDDDEVSRATFMWQADTNLGGVWMGEIEMGYAGGEIWSVDLPVDEITATVPVADLDSTRNIEFIIEARDPSGNIAVTPLYTMEILKPIATYEITGIDLGRDFEARAPEGTFISIPHEVVPEYLDGIPFTFRLSPRDLSEFNLPQGGATSINVIRTLELFATPGGGMDPIPLERLEGLTRISLHYPEYSIEGLDENLLAAYEYNHTTNTWIYLGGNVNPFGNLITIEILRLGTYGVFYNPSFNYDPNEVFSGIAFSPNPFSPNGDGLYEETNISFYLAEEAVVTIEIFDIEGTRVQILEERVSFTAEDVLDKKPRRITGIIWDGRDGAGRVVPYGIYIARFTVNFAQAAGRRTIRQNAAVAVIK